MSSNAFLSEFRPILLTDKPIFDEYLRKYPVQASECTFTNFFAWAEIRHHMWREYNDHLLVSYRGEDCNLAFFQPIGPDPQSIMASTLPDMHCYCWTRIENTLLPTNDLKIERDRANDDYVYDLQELRTLNGKKYDGKRNFIKRLEDQQPTVVQLDATTAWQCVTIQENWLDKQSENRSAHHESTALIKTLYHWDQLPVEGIGIMIGDTMAGFAIWEPLNQNTAVEHFEKGDTEYKGIYQYILHQLALSIPAEYHYLNREQDIGIPGLRKAKESWHPCTMIEKSTVFSCRDSSHKTETYEHSQCEEGDQST